LKRSDRSTERTEGIVKTVGLMKEVVLSESRGTMWWRALAGVRRDREGHNGQSQEVTNDRDG